MNSLAFSPNGRWLASVQAGGETEIAENVIHVWEVGTGREALRLPTAGGVGQLLGGAAADFVPGVAFSPDGQWLASTAGALYGVATQRELPDGRSELALRTGNAGPVSKLAFLGDGHVLASGSGALPGAAGLGDLRLWDISTGQTTQTLVDAWDGAGPLAFSPDGQTLATEEPFASRGGERAVRLWDLKAAMPLRTFTISTQGKGGQGFHRWPSVPIVTCSPRVASTK